jgi:hypothetical protein
MTAPNRELELTILEAASAQCDSPDLDVLLGNFGLQPYYRDLLIEVVTAGRWRGMQNPLHWTKQAVLGKIERLDQVRAHWREVSLEIDVVDFFQSVGEEDRQREYDDSLNDPGPMVLKLPEHLQISVYPDGAVDPVKLPDWEAIAALAGFDEWETEALKCMTFGDGEAKAMKIHDAPEDKRAIRAAFHRVQRTGFSRIRAALKIS